MRSRTEYRNRQDEESLRRKKLVGEMMKLPLIKEVLREDKATWLANPRGGSLLDIGFVPKRRKGRLFAGTRMFGEEECLGAVVCREDEKDKVWSRVQEDGELSGLLEQGGKISVLSEEELTCWALFYNQLKEEGIYDGVGNKTLEYSGLKRYSEVECLNLKSSLGFWMEQDAKEYFKEMKISGIEENKGRLDIAFMNKKDELVPIAMHNVRTGELKGEVLVEKVIEGSVVAPGWVVVQPGESKREAYERAQNLTRYYKSRIGEGYEVCVPVVSSGQISLWQKLGFDGEARSAFEREFGGRVRLSVNEVIRLLYLGKSNIEPGELVQYGLSLPGLGREFRGIDVMFYAKTGVGGDRRSVGIDGLKGLDLRKKKRDELGVLPMANVRGLVILPDGMETKEMRQHVASLQKDLNYRTLGLDGYLLYLTPSLFEEWKSGGSAFMLEEGSGIKNGFGDIEQRAQYGYGVRDMGGVSLSIYRQKPEIGGTKMIVWEEGKGGKERVGHGIDWGTSFTGGSALRSITAKEPTAIGIGASLKVGRIPMVPGIIDKEYLLATIDQNPNIGYVQGGDWVSSFIRSELCKRSSMEEVSQIVGQRLAKKIFRLGVSDMELWQEGIEQTMKNLLLSHAHIDHCGEAPYLDGSVSFVGSAETVAHLKAMTSKGPWRGRYDRITHVVSRPKIGARYQTSQRGVTALNWMNQTIRLSPNLTAEAGLVNHSMTGALQWGVMNVDGEGLVLNTGDFRVGGRTSETLEKFSGRFPIVVMETTNLDEKGKTSIGVTEEMVRDTMLKIVKESKGNTVIAVMPPNHIERMDSIKKVADMTGRRIALDVKHAEVVEQLRVQQYMMRYAEGFDFELPEIGEDVALWWQPRTAPKTYQKLLRGKAEMGDLGVVDSDRLSRQGGDWIVVVSPYNILRHVFPAVNFRNGLALMHCSFYPYEPDAKGLLAENIRWVNELQTFNTTKAKHYSDFAVLGDGGRVENERNYFKNGRKRWSLHASGHATFPQMVESIDILFNGKFKGKTLILMHGQNPRLYKSELQKKFGKNLKIVADITSYNPSNPIEEPGFNLRLA